MPRYTRSHYDELAMIVSLVDNAECRADIAEKLATLFEHDNDRFKRSLWFDACNVKSH